MRRRRGRTLAGVNDYASAPSWEDYSEDERGVWWALEYGDDPPLRNDPPAVLSPASAAYDDFGDVRL